MSSLTFGFTARRKCNSFFSSCNCLIKVPHCDNLTIVRTFCRYFSVHWRFLKPDKGPGLLKWQFCQALILTSIIQLFSCFWILPFFRLQMCRHELFHLLPEIDHCFLCFRCYINEWNQNNQETACRFSFLYIKKKMFILKQRMFRRLSVQFISCLIPIEHGLC